MDSGHGRTKMNVEGRLSSLPDELIHKILSSFDIKQVIEISCLSSRWRFIWTSMPYLNFSSKNFSTLPKFAKFVTHVLSGRNNHAEVYSLNFNFHGKATQVFVKKVLNYAFSHNIQRLNVVCSPDNCVEFPLSLLTCQSLKQLNLTLRRNKYLYGNCLTSTWELPALTTLDLHWGTLCNDNVDKSINIFSKCANLKNLTLKYFRITGIDSFSIVHPRLSNLTLENSSIGWMAVNVTTPQLKSLTIRDCNVKFVISAPNLTSFLYKGSDWLNISTDGFQSLEMADICVTRPDAANAHQIVSVLQVLHNVNFLTLNVALVELLSSSVGPLLDHLSPFVNLKSFKVYPDESYLRGNEMKNEPMSSELKGYLLATSPVCTFTIILPEEIIAQKLMAELRELLVKENDNTKRKKAPVKTNESSTEMMAQFESCWGNLVGQIEQRKKNVGDIISKLQRVEELVVKLPSSRRAMIQPCFSSLRAEAVNTLSKITDSIMICCEESQSCSNVLVHEHATKLMEPSSYILVPFCRFWNC